MMVTQVLEVTPRKDVLKTTLKDVTRTPNFTLLGRSIQTKEAKGKCVRNWNLGSSC